MGNDNWVRNNRGGNGSRRGGYGRGGYSHGGRRGGRSRGRGFGHRNGNRFDNNRWQNRPKKENPDKRLSEEEIGVTEYMGDHEGFNGIIKSRYSDFQVSEINLRGEVAQLTTLKPPEPAVEDEVEEDEELLLNKYNVEVLPMETWDDINKVAIGEVPDPVEIDVTTSTKEQRTKIHDAVKKAFGDSIVGSTINTEDKKVMQFAKYKKGVRIDKRVKWTWPAEFVHFIVHKQNCDTMDAAVRIAETLHIKPSMLGYAGTKDRRAVTSQWFSVRRLDPRKIAAAARDLRRDLHLGDYSFHTEHLKLGMLQGNKFRIGLRNVTASDDVINEACALWRDRGFINYYGLQRFGTRQDVPTCEVGKHLLKGNYSEAINCILSEREGPLQEALSLYKSRGAGCALAALPRYCDQHSEARLLSALADNPTDLCTALFRIPRNTRLLYLHSYQSLIWNRCVSHRLRQFSLTPAVGDLVPLEDHISDEIVDDLLLDTEETPETTDNPTTDDHRDKKEQTDKTKENEKQKVPVKVLTQEDIDSGCYTIFDVIMPLPGYLIEYPPNMKEYYESLLTADGLTLDMRHKNKSYSMSGAYRHVAVRPREVSWRCARYSDPSADLILSDRDLMLERTLPGLLEDGTYKAVILTMSLPVSCYATMALRELLKVDTSATTQANQNNYHKRKLDDATDTSTGDQLRGDISTAHVKEETGEGSDAKRIKTEE